MTARRERKSSGIAEGMSHWLASSIITKSNRFGLSGRDLLADRFVTIHNGKILVKFLIVLVKSLRTCIHSFLF